MVCRCSRMCDGCSMHLCALIYWFRQVGGAVTGAELSAWDPLESPFSMPVFLRVVLVCALDLVCRGRVSERGSSGWGVCISR
jgi:hypothetical protein